MTKALYRKIKDTIRARILSGQWPEGFQLPSEHKLLEEFKVSRMTVHRALRELTEENLLSRVQGVGTFVAERRPSVSIVELRSISDDIAARGNRHTATVQRLREVKADAPLARQFNLPEGATLFHSIVLHRENDVPIQYEERWVNPDMAPDYLKQDFSLVTPTKYLTQLYAAPDVEHVIEAALPGSGAAKLLNIAETEPCLRLTRRTWVQAQVITLVVLIHPGTRYRLGTWFRANPDTVPLAQAL
ncbi:histidine utilization repressor [Telmatospirillum sp. J64-1]|uniref:histidine utilization repressor n=1 Tax=Telmatospirillum sp. J64-1 TaxID=2502183 RepID=UPI00115DBDD1|nr:histidine utilization repressor [Telmatospirillum sp. J64-1]